MTEEAYSLERTCPDCGASNSPSDDRCWLCNRSFVPAAQARPTAAAVAGSSAPSHATPTAAVASAQVAPIATPPVPAAPNSATPAPTITLPTTPPPVPVSINQSQFGLSSLLLIVTVICLSLGMYEIAPGLIVPLVMIVAPALVRVAVASAAQARSGQAASVGSKASTFFASLAIVFLIWMAGVVAFGAACALIVGVGLTVNPNGNSAIGAMIVLSIGAGLLSLALVVWLFVVTLPNRKKK